MFHVWRSMLATATAPLVQRRSSTGIVVETIAPRVMVQRASSMVRPEIWHGHRNAAKARQQCLEQTKR